ncbi:hypothetical protein LTR48_004961 [Friedmanniomyces endolithicus]|uniref:Uncharacterized protein n=1 Tax=Friedmanniomyces endolithicus TaxID=329885 RepID=A0A4U0ULL4_9PEZI|nr:hypothetical protein LTS09_008513 [Friedmanniomyces endolithicus]KAK0948287.1 hypothetical protein LTR29_000404 [Friedmanniomyces endolithicus]KAK1084955.1 hypothetical protein LTR48_004961 [Friedmanniomyces endolithicus]KAK1822298.1 hypothetical protein LTR12_003238 [Friedmanniomyces endolithicus]TKA36584.1 hypothetical protein B0A54_11827 [Friedmanniomyces endolithicus]
MSTINDRRSSAAPDGLAHSTSQESASIEQPPTAFQPSFASQRSLFLDNKHGAGSSAAAAAKSNPNAAYTFSYAPPQTPSAYMPHSASSGVSMQSSGYPLPTPNQDPHIHQYTTGASLMAPRATQQPVPYFSAATQTQASGGSYNYPPPPTASAGLAQSSTVERLKIVHTTEPNHGQVLSHYKLGHYTKTAKNAKDEPKLKSKVPQAGGKTADVWRCAKADCSYCNPVARGYTDLTEALAFAHKITGVATAKKSYKEKGKTTTPTPQTITATNGGLAHTPHHANYQQNITATNSGIAYTPRHADYYGTMQTIASSGYFARPAAPSLQPPNVPPMHVNTPARNYGPNQDESTSAQSSATTMPMKQAAYSITDSRHMMTETTTGIEDTRHHQSLNQHMPEQQGVIPTGCGDGTIAPYMLALTPDSSDAMSWEEAGSGAEDRDTDADGTDADSGSPYPSRYMEANVRALMAESPQMHVTRVPGYDY